MTNARLLHAALAEPDAEPIGLLTIDKEARTFSLAQYEAFGDLPSGDYEIYTTQPPKPVPAPEPVAWGLPDASVAKHDHRQDGVPENQGGVK